MHIIRKFCGWETKKLPTKYWLYIRNSVWVQIFYDIEFFKCNFFSFVRVVPWNSTHGFTRMKKIILKMWIWKYIKYIRIMKDFDPTVCISVCRVMFWILLFWRTIFKKHEFVLEKAKFSRFEEYTKNEEHSCFFTKYLDKVQIFWEWHKNLRKIFQFDFTFLVSWKIF